MNKLLASSMKNEPYLFYRIKETPDQDNNGEASFSLRILFEGEE